MTKINKITLDVIKALYKNKQYDRIKTIYKFMPFQWKHCEHVFDKKDTLQEFISNDLHLLIIEHTNNIERFNFDDEQLLATLLKLIRRNSIKPISKIFEDKDFVQRHKKWITNNACASNCMFVVKYAIENGLPIQPYDVVAASYYNNMEIVRICLDHEPRLVHREIVENTIKRNQTEMLQYYHDKNYKYDHFDLECAYEHKCYEAAKVIYMNMYINIHGFEIILKYDPDTTKHFLNNKGYSCWDTKTIYRAIKHTYKNQYTWATEKMMKDSPQEVQDLIIKKGIFTSI